MDKSATELAQNRCDAQPSSAAGCLLFEGQRLTRRTTASSAFAVAWRPPRQLLGLDRSTSREMGPFPAGAPRALRTTIVTTLARTQWRNVSDMSDPTELSTAVNRQLEGFTRAADDRRSAEAQHHRNYESCLAILDQLLLECATMLNAAGVRSQAERRESSQAISSDITVRRMGLLSVVSDCACCQSQGGGFFGGRMVWLMDGGEWGWASPGLARDRLGTFYVSKRASETVNGLRVGTDGKLECHCSQRDAARDEQRNEKCR